MDFVELKKKKRKEKRKGENMSFFMIVVNAREIFCFVSCPSSVSCPLFVCRNLRCL